MNQITGGADGSGDAAPTAGTAPLRLTTFAEARAAADERLQSIAPPTRSFAGRGIVVVASGRRYAPGGWVLVNLLRHLGCRLPIEVWYNGPADRNLLPVEALADLAARCVDAAEVALVHPHPRLHGWELKPYAVLHSDFEEVLLLDCDNVPVRDPSFLFDCELYQRFGALFWPDVAPRAAADDRRWEAFGVPYADLTRFESAQAVIHKHRCWKPLVLCDWYNQHSDFYYQYVYGDQETFQFAWLRCEQPFAQIPHPSAMSHGLIHQYGLDGTLLFQHRHEAKWTLVDNSRIPGFQLEDFCLDAIDELDRLQSTGPARRPPVPTVDGPWLHLQFLRRPRGTTVVRRVWSGGFADPSEAAAARRLADWLRWTPVAALAALTPYSLEAALASDLRDDLFAAPPGGVDEPAPPLPASRTACLLFDLMQKEQSKLAGLRPP